MQASYAGLTSSLSWAFVASTGQQAITLVVSLVLAAMLGPEAFGTVAMALIVIGLGQLLIVQAVTSAVVQRSGLTDAELRSVLVVGVGVAGVLAGAIVAGAGWWSRVNNLPTLAPILMSLAIVLPVRAAGVVPDALLQRRLAFRSLAIRANTAAVVGGVVGIGLALAGWGLWALVAQQVATACTEVLVLWRRCPWRPAGRASVREAGGILRVAGANGVAGLGGFLNNQADALVVGLFFGPVAVGIYRLASRLVLAGRNMFLQPVRAITLPHLAPLQDDRLAFVAAFRRLVGLGSRLLLPALAVLGCAGPLVVRLLGPEWRPAVPAIALLALASAGHVVSGVIGPALQAMGRPWVNSATAWMIGVANLVVIIAMAHVLTARGVGDQVVALALIRVASLLLLVLPVGALWHVLGRTPLRLWAACSSGLVAAGVGWALGATVGRSEGLLSDFAAPVVAALAAGVTLLVVDPWTRRAARTGVRRLRRGATVGPSVPEAAGHVTG